MLNEIVYQSLLEFLWIGSVLGILIGAVLFFKPQQVMQLNRYFSRWLGSDKLVVLLDQPRWIERQIYRHHRMVGMSVTIGALVVLYTFLFSYNLRRISVFVPPDYWWLTDALMGMLLIGCVLAALIGFIVLIRPSLLRDIEKTVNRWISLDHLFVSFNNMNYAAEKAILSHNRLAGASIMIGSLYVLFGIGYVLLRWGGKL